MTSTRRNEKGDAGDAGGGFKADGPLAGPVPAAPGLVARVRLQFQVGVAELLLVNRLKARTRGVSATGILARAAQILAVTCKSWFSSGKLKEQQRSRPP